MGLLVLMLLVLAQPGEPLLAKLDTARMVIGRIIVLLAPGGAPEKFGTSLPAAEVHHGTAQERKPASRWRRRFMI
ncbi:MAG: hypothetical protein FWD68_03270 [Alphaproteobacteria bacterium]|nr:hypothetical protein [Alphaproteobacteria bacterium]